MTDLKNVQSIHKNLFGLLFLLEQRMKDIVQEEDSGLSMPEVLVLRTLVMEGEMSLIEVAQKTGKDKSQITRVIQDLVKKRILRKERSNTDRRSFILKLNVGVKEKMSFYLEKERELVIAMLQGIKGEDCQVIDKQLLKMNKNLKLLSG